MSTKVWVVVLAGMLFVPAACAPVLNTGMEAASPVPELSECGDQDHGDHQTCQYCKLYIALPQLPRTTDDLGLLGIPCYHD